MSIEIDLTDLVETKHIIEIDTNTAMEAIEQNFKENIEAGAPKELVEDHLRALKELQDRMTNKYLDAFF